MTLDPFPPTPQFDAAVRRAMRTAARDAPMPVRRRRLRAVASSVGVATAVGGAVIVAVVTRPEAPPDRVPSSPPPTTAQPPVPADVARSLDVLRDRWSRGGGNRGWRFGAARTLLVGVGADGHRWEAYIASSPRSGPVVFVFSRNAAGRLLRGPFLSANECTAPSSTELGALRLCDTALAIRMGPTGSSTRLILTRVTGGGYPRVVAGGRSWAPLHNGPWALYTLPNGTRGEIVTATGTPAFGVRDEALRVASVLNPDGPPPPGVGVGNVPAGVRRLLMRGPWAAWGPVGFSVRERLRGTDADATWILYTAYTQSGAAAVTVAAQPPGAAEPRRPLWSGGCNASPPVGVWVRGCSTGYLRADGDTPAVGHSARLIVVGRVRPGVGGIRITPRGGRPIHTWVADGYFLLTVPRSQEGLPARIVVTATDGSVLRRARALTTQRSLMRGY